eukprot:1820115-Rhodomonas_salina.1
MSVPRTPHPGTTGRSVAPVSVPHLSHASTFAQLKSVLHGIVVCASFRTSHTGTCGSSIAYVITVHHTTPTGVTCNNCGIHRLSQSTRIGNFGKSKGRYAMQGAEETWQGAGDTVARATTAVVSVKRDATTRRDVTCGSSIRRVSTGSSIRN